MCSAESVGSASVCTGPGCGQLHSASRTGSAGACWRGIGPACPSIPMCEPLPGGACRRTACHGRLCCVAASPARISARPGVGRGSMERGRCSGPRWRDWCPNVDRAGWWLRTFLASEAGGRTGFSVIWKRSATPAGRSWWVLGMPARRTGGRGCGWWPKPYMPTLVARDWKAGSAAQRGRRRACQLNDAVGGRLDPVFAEWMMGYPAGWTEK